MHKIDVTQRSKFGKQKKLCFVKDFFFYIHQADTLIKYKTKQLVKESNTDIKILDVPKNNTACLIYLPTNK